MSEYKAANTAAEGKGKIQGNEREERLVQHGREGVFKNLLWIVQSATKVLGER